MKCPNCGNELKEGAKFCGKCGTKIAVEEKLSVDTSYFKCPSCGNNLKPSAKFCGKCGTAISGARPASANADKAEFTENKNFVTWKVLEGQLAVKVDERTFDGYKEIKGIVIQEGVKAIFFADGVFVAELGSGKYEFNKLAPGELKQSFFQNMITSVANFFKPGTKEKLAGHKDFTIVLIRDSEVPLVFNFDNFPTASISCDVSIQVSAKISNIIQFYKTLLLDKTFVSFTSIVKNINDGVLTACEAELRSFSPDQFNSAQAMNAAYSAMNDAVSSVYPFIEITKVIRLTAVREELEELRRMSEELYISERELEELQRRNDFLNRLNDTNNAQTLAESQSQADFNAAIGKIDQQNLLTQDEKERFAMTLQAQRQISEAKTQEEVNAALHNLEKADILAEQEIELLKGQHQINLQRQNDSYADERRRAEMNLEKEEMQSQLDMLKQAQAIRQEREDAEHRRAMEAEQQKIDANLEKNRIYAGMSFEQIMAANPDISEAAAMALAEKFKSQNANESKQEMMNFMEKQMEMMRDMMGNQNAAKAAEIERINEASEKHQDRMAEMMQTTVNAVAGNAAQVRGSSNITASGRKELPAVCPNCGSPVEEGSSFCENCGSSL